MPGARELGAQATRDAILKAATKVFARHGYDGGRVEQISKAAQSYDRMIYYHYGSKEALFIAVLEATYERFNRAEANVELPADDPVAALTAIVDFMAGYYQRNPEFVTLLNAENLHRGRHIAKSLRAREYSAAAIGVLDGVLQQGVARGLFRSDVRARDVYLMIAAMGYFPVSNRYTLSAFFGEDLHAADALARWRAYIAETALRVVATAPAASTLKPARRAATTRGAT